VRTFWQRVVSSVALVVCAVAVLGAPAWAQTAAAKPLPASIALFPLPDIVLFPGVSRPLIIFEPRYRAMMADVLKGDRIIGMTVLRPGFEKDYEGRPPIFEIGCAGTIEDFEMLPDGRYTLVLKGLTKFRVLSEDQSRLYRVARVETVPDAARVEDLATLSALREKLSSLLMVVMPPGARLPPPELPDADYVNTIAQFLAMDIADRQALLEANGPVPRARALIDRLEKR
jgi:Lon protease-like protein